MVGAFVLASASLAGCSRCNAPGARGSAADAAGLGSSSVPDKVDAAADDAPDGATAEAGIEASAAVEIALEKAPPLKIRPVGPSAIEVALGEGGPKRWKPIEIERHVVDETTRQRDKLEQNTGRFSPNAVTRRIHAAKPATTYAYRARSAGAWSAEVTVRTAEAFAAPPAPTAFTATPTTPFAVRLTWQADASVTTGFEIEMAPGGNEYVRVAILDATERELVHHHRLPSRSYSYRVRAFNGRGVSPTSPTLSVTTPEHGHDEPAPLPPCKPLPSSTPAPENGMPLQVIHPSGGRELFNAPDRTVGLRRHLFGEYQGCVRELGSFELQDGSLQEVEGYVDEGFPLVRGIAGAGEYVGAQIVTMRFFRGRYTEVDVAEFCGAPYPDPDPADPSVGTEGGSDLTAWAPPFTKCQRDYPR